METFFRRHFQRKAPSPGDGQRRPSGVGLPAGKVRRRSPAGQASSSLIQRRRSSAQLQGCLAGCGLGFREPSRRRSSTAPPSCNPRFVVGEPSASPPALARARLPGAPLLLAGLVSMEEEGGSEHRAAARHLLPVPRCLRRRRRGTSHLFGEDAVYDPVLWGLHGYYRRLSQHPGPGGRRASGTPAGTGTAARLCPLSRRRQVALRRKSPAPQAWSARLV